VVQDKALEELRAKGVTLSGDKLAEYKDLKQKVRVAVSRQACACV
jgi:hypothetical protein